MAGKKKIRRMRDCFTHALTPLYFVRECIVLPNRQTQLIFVEESQKAVNCWGGGRGCIVSRSLALGSLADT